MGYIKDSINSIINEFHSETKGLSAYERRQEYESVVKKDVFNFLKQHYPKDSSSKINFYKELFDSWASFWESDLLLMNLFFERQNAYIIDSLCKSELIDKANPANLSSLSKAFLLHITGVYTATSNFTSNDERTFIQSFLMKTVPTITINDWDFIEEIDLLTNKICISPLIRRFTEWFNSNLSFDNIETIILAFKIFIKIWDTNDQFSRPFNNNKAIFFYNEINSNILARLSNESSSIYIDFIDRVKNVVTFLFHDLSYMPLLDNLHSIEYSEGYVIKRNQYHRLINDVFEINFVSTNCSYIDLLKSVSDYTPDYFLRKYLYTMMEKIKSLNHPSKDEINAIIALEPNTNVDMLRNIFFERLYIF